MASDCPDSIRFLGTAGARFVMISQARSSAGVLYSVGGFRLFVDPGPGWAPGVEAALARAIVAAGIGAARLELRAAPLPDVNVVAGSATTAGSAASTGAADPGPESAAG